MRTNKMKCKICGEERFYGHQICRMDVIVDGNGDFLDDISEGIESAIYDVGNPYGRSIYLR